MDAVSYANSAKQAQRIKKFINDPDSTSGIVTVPKVIASGETITIPTGRVAVLPNVQIDGVLNVENGGEVFIPSGSILSTVVEKVTSTDNAIVRFNGTTGAVQNSGVIINDNNNVGIGGNPNAKLDVRGSNPQGINQATYVGTIQINEGGMTSLNQVGGLEFKGSIFGVGYGTKILGTDDGTLLFGTRNNSALFTERLRIDSNKGNVLVTGAGALGYGPGSGGTVTQLTSKSTTVTLNKPTGQIIMNNEALAAGASVEFILNNTSIITYSIVTVNPVWINSNYKTEIVLNTTGAVIIRVTNMSGSSLSDSLVVRFLVVLGAVS